ncbi:MAG: CPCC family cysteine-rich protein [Ruminococcus sp.]
MKLQVVEVRVLEKISMSVLFIFYIYVPPAEDWGFICPVCFWENDPLIASNDDPSGSNHGITLNEAKSNYLKFGACEEEMLQYVRPPKSSEKGRS